MVKSVVVMGDGAWGLALAYVSCCAGSRVWVCSRKSPDSAKAIARERHPSWPEQVIFCREIAEVPDVHPLVIVATASCGIANTLRAIAVYNPSLWVVCASKGFARWQDRAWLPHELYQSFTHEQGLFAYVFGPSFSAEVMDARMTSLVIASAHVEIYQRVRACLDVPWLAIFRSKDVQGVAVCGLFKNVVAFVMGMVHALGYGENAKAMLFCFAMQELSTLMSAIGADRATAYSCAGLGDALLSGYTAISRNFQAGIASCAMDADRAQGLAESAKNIADFYAYMQRYSAFSLVVDATWNVLENKQCPRQVIDELYRRVGKED